jgi:tRNA threonylcarbamoyl adenosine modification protein YeaZ
MRILAIDTALAVCAAAVLDTREGLLASESLPMVRGHAEALLPLVARVMERAGCEFAGLDRVAVTVGPGSFTGLRVGIAAARGIALAADIAAVGLSTLAAYAAPHAAAKHGASILAVVDAKHDSVYLQMFGSDGRTLVAPQYASIRDAQRAATAGPTIITGSAANLVAADWPPGEPAPALVDDRAAPEIVWVARIGAAAELGDAPPKPLYLRAPDARPQGAARLPRR